MDIEKILPTCGQLERQLSQAIQSLYHLRFGHMLRKVVCHIFADKVAIVAEDTVTSIEQLLAENSQLELANNIRKAVNEAFTTDVKQQVTNILQVEVLEAISDSTLESGYMGMIVFLASPPETRLTKRKYRNQQLSQRKAQVISQ
ncbi:DUF2294 domain-containing protein [Pleurocapsales cyanobacterium LEGE 10410]|nr:DUF2294 domain-containing protein [Pleurocapsales cyanobacterium LEGE 10410]